MDFHPNQYSLVFISPIERFDDITEVVSKAKIPDLKLINILRTDQNLCGHYRDSLIISSPHTFDFFGDLGPFARKIIDLFPSKNIFVTSYYSVTSQRGICKIVNSSVELCIYQDEGEFDLNKIEDDYLLQCFGLTLPSILGLEIKMSELY